MVTEETYSDVLCRFIFILFCLTARLGLFYLKFCSYNIELCWYPATPHGFQFHTLLEKKDFHSDLRLRAHRVVGQANRMEKQTSLRREQKNVQLAKT
jgi:hypothetical protein